MNYRNKNKDQLGKFTFEDDRIKPGDIFESNNCGKFIVIRKINQIFDNTGLHRATGHKYYCIKFLETGYIAIASTHNILNGYIKDVKHPSVSNIGYLGVDIHVMDPEYETFYRSWKAMIKRCYDKNDKQYNAYGGSGVKVDPRWHSFINFFNDCKFLPNYEKKILYPEIYQLDKDYLQMFVSKSQKIYSNKTCLFLSKFDNSQIRNREKSIINGNKYFGTKINVISSDSVSYSTRIPIFDESGKTIRTSQIACFKDEFEAASLFNWIYPFITRFVPFHEINILNNINPIPYDELIYVCSRSNNDWFSFYPTYESMMNDWNTNKTYFINRKSDAMDEEM